MRKLMLFVAILLSSHAFAQDFDLHLEGEHAEELSLQNFDSRFGFNQVITCESWEKKYNSCSVPGQIVSARVLRRLSDKGCYEGINWGFSSDYVWVSGGCRASFEVETYGGGFPGHRPPPIHRPPPPSWHEEYINCESWNKAYTTCRTRNYIRTARVATQLSNRSCSYGITWGYSADYIWVDRGCRATFVVE